MNLGTGKSPEGVVLIMSNEVQGEVFQLAGLEIKMKELGAILPERLIIPGHEKAERTLTILCVTSRDELKIENDFLRAENTKLLERLKLSER